MIPSPFRIVEITLYSMLTFLPFVVMIFYPAREKLRFRPVVTGIFITVLALAHLTADTVIALDLYPDTDLVILASFLAHGLIYLLLFRQPFGRTLFAWLAVTNLAALVTTAAKCLENVLFPGMVYNIFGLSYLFLLLVTEALLMGPSLLLVKRFGLVFRFQKLHWNIAWILPAACTAFWYIYMYIGFSFADTWITIRPANTLFLVAVNLLFGLICFKPTIGLNGEKIVVDEALEAAKAEAKAQRAAERAEAKARRAAERAEAKAKREAERAEAKAKREAEKAEQEAAKAAADAAATAEETVPADPGETPAAESNAPTPTEAPTEKPSAPAPAAEISEEEIETVIVEVPDEEPPTEAPAEEVSEVVPTGAPAEESPKEAPVEAPAEEPTEEAPVSEAPAEEPVPVPSPDPQEYLLRVQTIQHVNMLEKMAEAHRVNQNLQLQLNMMETSLAQNDYRKLREQLRTFQTFLPAPRSKPFCENATVDALLQYYAQTARNHGTVFNADVRIPANIAVRGRDLTVLLGNLLDNAIDAVRSQNSFDRQIIVQGAASGDALRFVIENTYEVPVQQDENGTFRSTKHSGNGIGIEIAREIAHRYNGLLEYEITDKRCKAFIELNP